MHDWLRGALDQVPLLHGGVRSVVERCPTPGDAFWLYDLPELVAWVALARAASRSVPAMYGQALAAEIARAALLPVSPASTPLDRAATYWRKSAAFSALAALGEHADGFEPFDARRIARAQEQVFLSMQIGESLQGVHFMLAVPTPMPSEQSDDLRKALSDLVGDWAAQPADYELRRRHARAAGESTRRQFGLSRGTIDPDDKQPLTLRRWTDVLAVAGVVEAPDLAVEELLPQMESSRDLLLVRCADLAARGLCLDIERLGRALLDVVREALDEALADARQSLDRVASDEGLRALPASNRRWNRAGAACALRCALAQADAVALGPMTASRALSLVRWSAELGERLEVWCEGEEDDRTLTRLRNVMRGPLDMHETLRPPQD
jgi:hypothetical protein